MLETNDNRIYSIRQKNITTIEAEVEKYGDFEGWYEKHSDLRKRIEKKYIRFRSPYGTYRRLLGADTHGRFVDHHILSYLTPENYVRIGWGGRLLHDFEQIDLLAKFFKKHGVRFIYVPVPNKGMIYPDMIDVGRYENYDTPNYPLQRRMVYSLLQRGIEVVDIFGRFENEKNCHNAALLYKNCDHNLSSYGSYIVADEIGKYIKCTTSFLEKEKYHRYIYKNETHTGYACFAEESAYICFKHIEGAEYTMPCWCENSDSDIAIFGDCNLQSNELIGAGIAANLSYELQYPLYNAGRQLLFEQEGPENLDVATLSLLKEKKLVMYVAFASAGFVRSSSAEFRRLLKPQSWNTMDLDTV